MKLNEEVKSQNEKSSDPFTNPWSSFKKLIRIYYSWSMFYLNIILQLVLFWSTSLKNKNFNQTSDPREDLMQAIRNSGGVKGLKSTKKWKRIFSIIQFSAYFTHFVIFNSLLLVDLWIKNICNWIKQNYKTLEAYVHYLYLCRL